MNINLLNSNYQNNAPKFAAIRKPVRQSVLNELPADKLELSENIGRILPERFEFGEMELKAKELLTQIRRLQANVVTQKRDLKSYYSAQNRNEYRELLKERNNVNSKFSRLAKKMGLESHDLAHYISEKNDYNFYAPKIFRAKTIEELEQVKSKIDPLRIHKPIVELLYELIEYRKTLLK